MTNAFMLVPFFAWLHQFAYTHRPVYTRGRDGVQDLTSSTGNVIGSFLLRKYTLVRSQTRHTKSLFRHSWSTMYKGQESSFTRPLMVMGRNDRLLDGRPTQ